MRLCRSHPSETEVILGRESEELRSLKLNFLHDELEGKIDLIKDRIVDIIISPTNDLSLSETLKWMVREIRIPSHPRTRKKRLLIQGNDEQQKKHKASTGQSASGVAKHDDDNELAPSAAPSNATESMHKPVESSSRYIGEDGSQEPDDEASPETRGSEEEFE